MARLHLMPRLSVLALLAAILASPVTLLGQSRAGQLVDSARAQVAANHFDSAAVLLRAALDTAAHAVPVERTNALVWDGIVQFLRGHADLARAAFRHALALDSTLDVKRLDQLSPELAQLFQREKQAAVRQGFFYASGGVDEPPRRLSGPAVAYPPSLLRRHAQGLVEVSAIIDTAGRTEPASLQVLSAPDSDLIEPVKQMMLASQFSPGRLKGVAVRVMVKMGVDVRPPRVSATELVGTARRELGAGHPDSALTLLEIALDTALTHPTDGERVYALLVRGVAATRAGRDSAGRSDLGEGLALYQAITARGVDLAPFLRRLADSVRLGRRGAKPPGAAMPAPTAVGAVDEQPTLVSHPPIRYPPEMQALRVDGTVLVEAALDATGHVEPGSAKIVQSPNHAFDEEALRVVRGSVYRPASSKGRVVRAVIRQAIAFVNY
jgi:TonB family protein